MAAVDARRFLSIHTVIARLIRPKNVLESSIAKVNTKLIVYKRVSMHWIVEGSTITSIKILLRESRHINI